MKSMFEGFCHGAGALVGLMAALIVIGYVVEDTEKKSQQKEINYDEL